MSEKIDPATLIIGQPFLDEDGALCIYLGYAMETRIQKDVGRMNVYSVSYGIYTYGYHRKCVYQMFYKNTWIQMERDHVNDIRAYELNDKAQDLMGKMAGHYVHKHSWCCEE